MENDKVNYYDKTINDLHESIIFKFKKLNPIEIIQLVTDNMSVTEMSKEKKQEFTSNCLQNVLWQDEGGNWVPLLDANNNGRCMKLDDCPQVYFDLFNLFKKDVLTPVFTESKTFQKLLSLTKQKKQDN